MMPSPAYRHDIVRDLAWVIGSPPLIRTQAPDHASGLIWLDANDCQAALAACQDQLLELDTNPAPLLNRLSEEPDRRLGHRFETLLAQWLEWDPRYQLLAKNLQVQSGGQTIGEFDFIVLDREQNQYFQLEVACKFYLGLPDTQDPSRWFGPMLRDRLDIKLNHMRQQQSQLAQHPAAQHMLAEHGWQIDQTRCLMKGRLFYPLTQDSTEPPSDVATDHPHGQWCRWTTFAAQADEMAEAWEVLAKHDWFSSRRIDPTMPTFDAAPLSPPDLDQPFARPVCLAGLVQQQGLWIESQRLFVVPDHWNPPNANHE